MHTRKTHTHTNPDLGLLGKYWVCRVFNTQFYTCYGMTVTVWLALFRLAHRYIGYPSRLHKHRTDIRDKYSKCIYWPHQHCAQYQRERASFGGQLKYEWNWLNNNIACKCIYIFKYCIHIRAMECLLCIAAGFKWKLGLPISSITPIRICLLYTWFRDELLWNAFRLSGSWCVCVCCLDCLLLRNVHSLCVLHSIFKYMLFRYTCANWVSASKIVLGTQRPVNWPNCKCSSVHLKTNLNKLGQLV